MRNRKSSGSINRFSKILKILNILFAIIIIALLVAAYVGFLNKENSIEKETSIIWATIENRFPSDDSINVKIKLNQELVYDDFVKNKHIEKINHHLKPENNLLEIQYDTVSFSIDTIPATSKYKEYALFFWIDYRIKDGKLNYRHNLDFSEYRSPK